MALKLMFSNDPSIHERARKAVQKIARDMEKFPDWPKEDLAFAPTNCSYCGEHKWLPLAAHMCESCATQLRTARELNVIQARNQVEKKMRKAAKKAEKQQR
jgi:hypothetical protein